MDKLTKKPFITVEDTKKGIDWNTLKNEVEQETLYSEIRKSAVNAVFNTNQDL